MPLYEYQCRKCRHRFERIQKFSDPEVKKCPQCGGAVERLLSAPAVQFKGSGWYVTDYARKGGGGEAKAGEGGTGETKSGASGDGAMPGKNDAAPKETASKTESEHKSESKKPARK